LPILTVIAAEEIPSRRAVIRMRPRQDSKSQRQERRTGGISNRESAGSALVPVAPWKERLGTGSK
jgi:hypothetical protein